PGFPTRPGGASSRPPPPPAAPPATNAPSPSSMRPCRRSLNPPPPSSAGSSSHVRPASWRTSKSPSAKRSCSAPFAIRSTALYRRSSWGKRKDDERHRSQAVPRQDGLKKQPPDLFVHARELLVEANCFDATKAGTNRRPSGGFRGHFVRIARAARC